MTRTRCAKRAAVAVVLAVMVPAVAMSWRAPVSAGAPQVPAASRAAAVAGTFYPSDAGKLKSAIDGYLRDAVAQRVAGARVLVVPHAGYVYSGQIAADAFKQTAGQTIETVVILGANHTTAGSEQIAVFDGDAWQTPLGAVGVDRAFAQAVVDARAGAVVDRRPHEREHSVEVQVPFVQVLHPKATIVPIVVGTLDPAQCSRFGRAIAALARDRAVLIVASSDLSHYAGAADARRLDVRTLESIVSGPAASLLVRAEADVVAGEAPSVPGLVTRACGLGPLLVAVEAARELGAKQATVLSYANSADTALGSPDRVVGYGAVAFAPGLAAADTSVLAMSAADGDNPLDVSDKRALLHLARETLKRFFTSDTVPLPRGGSPRLLRETGAFVTLRSRGELRGCVGRVLPEGPLPKLVSAMALAAAFADPRFGPLKPHELPGIEIEVSVLTPPRAVKSATEIVSGRDGVVFQLGDKSALFLPNVAEEQGWTRNDLLDNLAIKAGLPASAWRDRKARFQTFRADVFSESTVR